MQGGMVRKIYFNFYPDKKSVTRHGSLSPPKDSFLSGNKYASFTIMLPLTITSYFTFIQLKGDNMILSNLETVPGRKIEQHLGLVQGSSVRAKHVGRDFMAGLKNIVGGELKAYTELLQESRDEATQRMIAEAKAVNANAVLNIRLATSTVAAGAAEVFVYGTAVILAEE